MIGEVWPNWPNLSWFSSSLREQSSPKAIGPQMFFSVWYCTVSSINVCSFLAFWSPTWRTRYSWVWQKMLTKWQCLLDSKLLCQKNQPKIFDYNQILVCDKNESHRSTYAKSGNLETTINLLRESFPLGNIYHDGK